MGMKRLFESNKLIENQNLNRNSFVKEEISDYNGQKQVNKENFNQEEDQKIIDPVDIEFFSQNWMRPKSGFKVYKDKKQILKQSTSSYQGNLLSQTRQPTVGNLLDQIDNMQSPLISKVQIEKFDLSKNYQGRSISQINQLGIFHMPDVIDKRQLFKPSTSQSKRTQKFDKIHKLEKIHIDNQDFTIFINYLSLNFLIVKTLTFFIIISRKFQNQKKDLFIQCIQFQNLYSFSFRIWGINSSLQIQTSQKESKMFVDDSKSFKITNYSSKARTQAQTPIYSVQADDFTKLNQIIIQNGTQALQRRMHNNTVLQVQYQKFDGFN